ncbi:MAG: hypothetical protein II477_11350, partial [Lachnospiraceae bacterium]|nr:hypothetical protein [Lachnospiraceae bacterium]
MDGTCPITHCQVCWEEVDDDYCEFCSNAYCDGCLVVCYNCLDVIDNKHCQGCFVCFTDNPDLRCEFNPDYCNDCCHHCEECGLHIFAPCFVNEDASHCCACAEDLGAYQWCRLCGQYHCDLCGDGLTFDRDDEICEECIDGYELWCDICQTAEEDREYDQDGPGQHCIDCCELCPQCGECVIGKEKEVCDICNLCVQCCKELSEEYGCTSGEVCIEDGDWDAHICDGCGICACEADMCEYCGLCEECCAQKTMCSSGMCVEDPEYEEHFCEECGECFCDVTPCDTCANARLCEGCCADRSEGEGCPHGICMDSYEWDEHRCSHGNCYKDCVECLEAENEAPQQHVHVWDANNICTICYARNDGRPVIVEQPRDAKASLRATYQGLAIMPKVHFTARAYGNDAQYEWHIVGKGKITEGEYGITGTNTSTITVEIPDDGCNGFYTFQCRIYNDKGEVWSDEASLVQDHLYTGLWKEDNTDSTMHYRTCVGEGCGKTVKEKHVYNGWNIVKEATQNEDGKAVRTCIDCGHEEVLVLPSFSRHVHDWKAEAMPNNRNKHRVACSLCLHVKELVAHDYGDWVFTVKPTEDTKGKQQRTCKSCGYVQTGEAPLLEHVHFSKYYYHPADGSLTFTHDGCIEYTCLNDDGTENPLFHYQICTATIGGKECGFKSKEYMSKHHWNGNTSGQNGFYRDPETDEVYRECIYCGYREYSDMPGFYCYMLHGNAEYYNEKGEQIYWAKVGDKVTACPATKVEDVYFTEWESNGGQCFVLRDKFKKMELDETQKKTKYLTFTMPDQPVLLFCQYQTPSKDVCTHEYTNPKNGKTTSFIEETFAAKEATCTSVGQTRGTQCMACYKEIEKHKTIPATGHDIQLIESTVITPTCTATGYTGDSRCTKCGQIFLGDPLPRLGHEYSTELEIIKYPDCIHKGYYGYRCTREGCQHYMKEVEIPATGHVNTVSEGDKNYHWARCIECDVIVVGTREKHNYDRPIIRGGVEYLVCSVCGASKLAENATNQGENKLATISYHAAASGERYCEVERVYQVIGETITLMDPDELGFLPPENMEFRYWSIGSHKFQPGDTYKIVDSEEEICAYWSTPQETVDAVISAKATFPAPGVRVSDMSFYATYSSNYTYYAYGGAEEWYNAETGKKLEKNDRFEFGKAYYLKVRFSQKDASKFLVPTLESVKNMRIVLDTTYYSAASSPKDGFMNGQAFTVEQDGSISIYFGLSSNSNEVYTYDYTSLGITSKVTAQVPEGEVVTYRLQNFYVVTDEYEEYNPNIDGEEVREVATILSVSAQNSIMRDEHVEASIDGTTWYKMSELLNTGFGGLYPNTTYKVQLRRTDLGNRLNPFAGQPVVFYETTVKTPSIPEAYLYQGAWPISELAFEQGAYENIFQLEDAVITAEVQGVYYPTIRYKVTSDKLEDFCDKKMYVTLTKRNAGHPETVVGGGVAKLQADGTFLYKIPEGLSCNTAYAFFMGFESNGTGKVDDVWYSTIKWTGFDFAEMKIVGIQNTKEWVTADTAWVTTQNYGKLMGEPIPKGKKLHGWYSVTDGKEYVIGTDRWIDIYLKGAVTLYPVWDTQYYYGDRVMLFDVEPVKGEQASLDKVKFSGKVGEFTHSSARLTTAQELKAAMIAASNYSLSDEEWAALDNECENMIATNGWYYKEQKFTGTFVKGEEYTLKLYVSSDCGSDFSTSDRNLLWIDAKGQEQYTHCELVPGSNNQIARVELRFTAKTPATEVQTITSASVTLDKMPKIGEDIFVPTLTTDGNSKFETTVYDDGLLPGWFEDDPTNDYLWYPGGSGWMYCGRETFEEGRNYYVCLKLAANDGYKFPEISTNEELAAFLSLSMGGKSVAVKTANGNENPNFELHQYKTPTENEIVVVVNWKAEAAEQVDKKLSVTYAHTCTVGNDLSLNYYIDATALTGYENIRLVVEKRKYNADGSSF